MRPVCFKFRGLENYSSFLDKLPQHAYENTLEGEPELVVHDEVGYNDFDMRHDRAGKENPLYHSAFCIVLGHRPK